MLEMFCLLIWAMVTWVFLLYNSLLNDTRVCILNPPPNILKYGHLRMKKSEARTLVYYSYFTAALKKKRVMIRERYLGNLNIRNIS